MYSFNLWGNLLLVWETICSQECSRQQTKLKFQHSLPLLPRNEELKYEWNRAQKYFTEPTSLAIGAGKCWSKLLALHHIKTWFGMPPNSLHLVSGERQSFLLTESSHNKNSTAIQLRMHINVLRGCAKKQSRKVNKHTKGNPNMIRTQLTFCKTFEM